MLRVHQPAEDPFGFILPVAGERNIVVRLHAGINAERALPGEGYTVLRIDDVTPIQAIAEPFQIRLLRRELGVQAFGINAYTAPAAGDRVIEEHD